MAKSVPRKELRPDQEFDHYIPEYLFDWIGKVAAAWSYLELTLDDLIWHFLDLSDDEGRIITSRMDAQRKIVTLREIAPSKLSQQRLGEFEALLRTIDTLKEDRNFVIHGVWGSVKPERIPAALSLRPKEDPNHVTLETFPAIRMKSISDRIDHARFQIVDLTRLLGPLRKRQSKQPLS